MLVFEAKLEGTDEQYRVIDEMIQTARFVRNSCLRYWIDNRGVKGYDLNKYCKELRNTFEWCKKLSAQACQASAERIWFAITRFYENCKQKKPGKKGFPKFKNHRTHGTVEYKVDGWKLSDNRREITFRDGFRAGTFKMWGTRDLHFYQLDQIKRVRVVRRADGYYVQFCIKQERKELHELTGITLGIDVGLNHFLTDSEGTQVENPRFLIRDEKALKKAQRRLSRKFKKPAEKGQKVNQTNNYKKNRNRLGRKHLKVQRRRKDFAVKLARAIVQSSDLVAFEDLKVANMIKNHRLAKSISDAAWSQFRGWLEYFGKVFGVPVVAVPPHYTSQDCSKCGTEVKKTLSTRTHNCPHCKHIQDRDWNAAINILRRALQILAENTALLMRKLTPGKRMTAALKGKPRRVSQLEKPGKLSSNVWNLPLYRF